ncbi:DUF559 domain-containing protein [Dyadobacter sp. CY323]|nr:DUF559 domain-containing protein [Dyadobacter sp. CY323]
MRSDLIREFGIQVIRFTNDEILSEIGVVLQKIRSLIPEHT